MTPPAETPKPDQDAGLIAEARKQQRRISCRSVNTQSIIARLADTLAVRDRQIAGLVEALGECLGVYSEMPPTALKARLGRVLNSVLGGAPKSKPAVDVGEFLARAVRSLEDKT